MTKSIPEIDDLIKGINDTELALGETQQPVQTSGGSPTLTGQSDESSPDGMEKCWEDFLTDLERNDRHEGRGERLVCKIDRDLADSLDDCDIFNRCRSDLVNAIVRAFFGTFLPRLANYRREKKSLFTNFKEERHV